MANSRLPRPREAVRSLPAYRTSPVATTPIVYRASSNESPFPPSESVRRALIECATRAHLYPVPRGEDLITALSRTLGHPEDRFAVDAGSNALLDHILHTFAHEGSRVVYPWRSFEAYPISVRAAGATPVQVANRVDSGHDVAGLIREARTDASVLVLCSPNNPTGVALTADELLQVLESVPQDVLVILDEAYVDFVVEGAFDSLPLIDRHPNLLVLRTFSKCYALAGLRAGYCIGHPDVVAEIRKVLPAFAISAAAASAATAALRDTASRAAVVDAVVSERRALTALLRGRGYPVYDSQANFVFVPVGEDTARLTELFMANGVLTRPWLGEGVRITVGLPGLAEHIASFLPAHRAAERPSSTPV